jgi:hypothetical protein
MERATLIARKALDELIEADYLLDDGDEAGALAAADAMIRAAETVGGDQWDEHDLLHNGHIVRGTIF